MDERIQAGVLLREMLIARQSHVRDLVHAMRFEAGIAADLRWLRDELTKIDRALDAKIATLPGVLDRDVHDVS